MAAVSGKRRGRGEDSIYWDECPVPSDL